jgi:hypothetical protein
MNFFSKRLEKALEAVRDWPVDRQEVVAEVLEHMNRLEVEPYMLSEEQRIELEDSVEEARRGEFTRDAQVAAIFARYGL